MPEIRNIIPERIVVLVAEDDSVTRMFLEDILSGKYEVLVASNGASAWEILKKKQHEIHVVLTDINMPGLSGMELLDRIRQDYPHVGVIMMSGSSDIRTAVKALRQGAYDYVSKPLVDKDEIDLVIQRWKYQQSLEVKLKQYALLHSEMLKRMKIRTFVSLDVVGSKDMKKKEDPFLIQYTFAAYQRFISQIVLAREGEIHSTAGDGVMARFILAKNALNAAIEILSELSQFNLHQNQLSGAFQLRIGIHAGPVIIDDNGLVDEMFSETLDIASHIQKQAQVDNVLVSVSVYEMLPDSSQFVPTGESLDELPLYSLITGL